MSTSNLKRALRIEHNLTDSMKELIVYYVLIISCVNDFWGNLECYGYEGELAGCEVLRGFWRNRKYNDN